MEENVKIIPRSIIPGSLGEESWRLPNNAPECCDSSQVSKSSFTQVFSYFFPFFSLPAKKHNKLVNWAKNFEFQAKKIDVFSRVFFPFVFAMFNIWYWSYYLSKSHK